MDQGQTPVNPYAPAGAPYAPGSNTPPPTFATPAVPNTAATPSPSPAYTSISTSSSPVFTPDQPPQKERFFSKKFIIFASVSLALIVAAIITGVILQNNRNNGSTQAGSASTTGCASDFYKYANYILDGTDSSAPLGEEPPSLAGSYLSYAFLDDATVSTALETTSAASADGGDAIEVEAKDLEANYPKVDRATFLNTAKDYLDTFYNCQASASNNNLEPLTNYVAVFNELADLPAADSADAEKGFELRMRIIDELEMVSRVLKEDNE